MPENHLRILKSFPHLSKWVDIYKSADDLPAWPKNCFLPMAAWVSMAAQAGQPLKAAHLAALGTWRYTRAIYKIDGELGKKLAKTKPGKLPSEVLQRLPNFCIYVDTKELGIKHLEKEVLGFFAHLEWDIKTKLYELRLLIDSPAGPRDLESIQQQAPQLADQAAELAGLKPVIIPLAKDASLGEAMQSINAPKAARDHLGALAEEIQPLVNILLYLGSESPDISPRQAPDFAPSEGVKQKVSKGRLRLFPASKNKVFTVGEKLKAALKTAENRVQAAGRKGPAPHIRRAHWHGYWVGPRANPKFKYKWVAPTLVNSREEENEIN